MPLYAGDRQRPPELADRCGDAGAVFRAVNADAAAIRGLEAAARLELGAGLSLLGSATWTRGDARLAGGMTEPLPKVPPLHGAAMLSKLDSPHRVHGSGVDGAGRGVVVSIASEIR